MWQQLTAQSYFNPGGYSTIQVGLGKSFATSALQQGQSGVPLKQLFWGAISYLLQNCKLIFIATTECRRHFFENLQLIVSTLKLVHVPIPKMFLGILQKLKPERPSMSLYKKGQRTSSSRYLSTVCFFSSMSFHKKPFFSFQIFLTARSQQDERFWISWVFCE